jgi:hypothetical protein
MLVNDEDDRHKKYTNSPRNQELAIDEQVDQQASVDDSSSGEELYT